MNVGIVGLGLIGGSFARAYKEKGHQVFAYDRDRSVLSIAQMAGVVDAALDAEHLPQCALILIALYPQDTIAWLEEAAPLVVQNSLVMDTCGVKQAVCPPCFALAKCYGFRFVGGHPMAGTQFSGFKFSRASLFKGASLVVVPEHCDDIVFLDHMKACFPLLNLGGSPWPPQNSMMR